MGEGQGRGGGGAGKGWGFFAVQLPQISIVHIEFANQVHELTHSFPPPLHSSPFSPLVSSSVH